MVINKTENAIVAFENALDFDHIDLIAMDTLSRAYRKQDNYKKAGYYRREFARASKNF